MELWGRGRSEGKKKAKKKRKAKRKDRVRPPLRDGRKPPPSLAHPFEPPLAKYTWSPIVVRVNTFCKKNTGIALVEK